MSPVKGFALVIVMWIISLLTIMAASFAQSMQRETAVASAVKQRAQVHSIAEAGINLAQFMLQAPEPEKRWRGDGRIYQVHFQDVDIRIRIFSERGKVDLNAAGQKLLQAVIASRVVDKKMQQQLVDAILDWRDADEEPRKFGAEKEAYQRAGRHYLPRNAAFQSLEELQQVLGMDENLYTQLRPMLTVYSGQSEVDVEVASAEVLQAVGAVLERDAVDTQLKQRQAGQSASELSDEMEVSDELELGQAFTIIAEARLEDDTAEALLVTVRSQADDTEKPFFEIIDWQTVDLAVSLFAAEMDSLVVAKSDEFKYRP